MEYCAWSSRTSGMAYLVSHRSLVVFRRVLEVVGSSSLVYSTVLYMPDSLLPGGTKLPAIYYLD